MRTLLAIFIGLTMLLLPVGEVTAQEMATDSDQSATNSSQTSEQVENEEKIAELRKLYTLQIESYRQAEREFTIAKEQYQELETLRLLEEAVQATRNVMIARNRVLLTYSEMLYFTMQEATGINLLYKEEIVEALEVQVNRLREYQVVLEETDNREEVAQRVQEFSQMQPELESVTYRALSLIAIGKLQTVHDKARLILTDLQEAQAEASSSALRKAQLERAYRETERNLATINDQLRQANDDYARQDRQVRRTFYDNMLDDLEPTFAQLSQLISYLQELLTI